MEHRGGKDNAVDSAEWQKVVDIGREKRKERAAEMDDKAEIWREREIDERRVC